MKVIFPLKIIALFICCHWQVLPIYAFQNEHKKAIETADILHLSEDGSWCWFQDDRAILDGDRLLFSGVTSKGTNTVTTYNFLNGEKKTAILQENMLPPDDHNVGVLMRRPDGKYLTVFAGHGVDSLVRYRVSTQAGDIGDWEEEKQFQANGRVTYSNVYRLAESGITYNFYRGNQNNPHYLLSTDDGGSWESGGRLFEFPGRSYLRYASDGYRKIHFITTDGHPRHYNNNIYHGYIENGQVYQSDGTKVGDLSTSSSSNLKPSDFTLVYDGNLQTRMDVAWTSDIKLDVNGQPYVVFSVTKDPITRGETANTQLGGSDHRYHYARWDGKQWRQYEIAYAGSRLYPGENEYTGLISLHPRDPNVVFISSDVYPETGQPILVNGERRYEIFKGKSINQGRDWKWSPVTSNSNKDNIRPIVLADGSREVVIWLNGRYTTYKDYDLSVLGIVRDLQKEQNKTHPNILFLVSKDPDNYEGHRTIPDFALQLEENFGYNVKVIQGEGPRNATQFPDLEESIEKADLLVVFARRLALPEKQMDRIQKFLSNGKPLVGIRTANHAFSVRNEVIPEGYKDWGDFVPDILGCENRGYGPTEPGTAVKVVKKSKRHPILKDFAYEEWQSQGNVYLVAPLLDRKAKVLLTGQEGKRIEPIAWTRKAGKSKVFYTSLGHPSDFETPEFLDLLERGILWALQKK